MNIKNKFLNPNSINLENRQQSYKQLIKLFHCVEDAVYLYESTDEIERNPELKEEIERYIVGVANWFNKNKEKVGSFNHRLIKIFNDIETDIKSIDDIVAKLITPIHNNTLYNWLSFFKSSDAFYLMQGAHKNDGENLNAVGEIINTAINNARKSVKVEKIAGYHLYILSGQASKDYIPNGTGDYYKEKAENAINKKELNLIAPPGSFDGEITTEDERLILFATSNSNTSQQDVFKVLREDREAKIVFVFSPMFNQKYSHIDTEYNGRKAEQHGTAFLKLFDTDFSFSELADFNVLPFMAIINNIDITKNRESSVSDFLRVNPFTFGTDTYYLYKDLRDMNEYEEPEKTERLQEYLVSYLERIINKLKEMNSGFKINQATESILLNTQRVIAGTIINFNKLNLSGDLPSNSILERIASVVKGYNEAVDKINFESSKSTIGANNPFLQSVDTKEELVAFLQKINSNIGCIKKEPQKKINTKLTTTAFKNYVEFFNTECKIPIQKAINITQMIKVRQITPKQKAFLVESLGSGVYLFFQQHRAKEPYLTIFKIIEHGFDFNDPNSRIIFKEQLKLVKYNEDSFKEGFSIDTEFRKNLAAAWKKIAGTNYTINTSFLDFISLIESKKENGISVYEARQENFHKTNIEYKESQNSYFKNQEHYTKSKYHHELMVALGLYDFKLGKQEKINIDLLNDRLKSFLLLGQEQKNIL